MPSNYLDEPKAISDIPREYIHQRWPQRSNTVFQACRNVQFNIRLETR